MRIIIKTFIIFSGIFSALFFFSILQPNKIEKKNTPLLAPETIKTIPTAEIIINTATTSLDAKITEIIKFSSTSVSATKPKSVVQSPKLKHAEKSNPLPTPPPASVLPATTTAKLVSISNDEIYNSSKPAILNIWCEENNKITSGTATIIHPQGILLTNAHVLAGINNMENCVLRSWNPFANVAKFKKLFIPDQTKIIAGTENLPQYDFAFIKITERLGDKAGNDLPWTYLPILIEESPFKYGDTLFILSYATEFFSYEISVKGIPLLFTTMEVKETVTIDNNNQDVDALLMKSAITNQSGSSGGPLINTEKNLVAMLTFVSKGKTTGEREGIAILASYINRAMLSQTGVSLEEFIRANAE